MQEPFDIGDGPEDPAVSQSAREAVSCPPARLTPPLHETVTAWLAHGKAGASNVPAVRFNGVELNYGELDSMSNRIAHALKQHGVRSGDRVGLCLNRSIEMVAALVGILKSGAAYVPFDADYPRERLNMMQEDARMRLILVHEACTNRFDRASCPVLVWETFSSEVEQAPDAPVAVAIDREDVAYIIFTSGSTGRPKGIAMPHRALANLIEWQLERKTFQPAARVLQYSSISFDVSFQEIATTLASGGTLHLISNDDRKDPRTLLARLVECRIERLFLPYVAMRGMIEAAHVVGIYPEGLKEVITAGEQLRIDASVRGFFAQIEGVSLDNQYGPSETHVITAHLLEGDPAAWPDLPPIGVPLKNCRTYILNEAMKPVPAGQSGELHLAGRNLAHGYINRPDITSEVFLANPFEHPGFPRLYKTGDLAVCNPDGSIDFLGRRDHQIKIRGHRIEPGEINNAAAAFPGIGHCFTHAARRDDGMLRLVAYYTVKPGEAVDPKALRAVLARKLPDYMVPAFLVEIDDIPYTPSGKVDLKALPRPQIDHSQYGGDACVYRSATEKKLAGIWSELLGLEGIPRSADFFELGGDSLRAVTLFLRIQQQFGRELPLSTLVHASTLVDLAKRIEGHGAGPDLAVYRSLQLLKQGDSDVPPLFLVHGGKGNVLAFKGFADELDPKQSVYAFQWSGWDGSRGVYGIPEMARAYAAEIKRFLQGSSCRLGGNCIGGLIATEMARILKEQGISVDRPLLIWDSPNLASPSYHANEPWSDTGQLAVFERVKEELLDRTPEPLRAPIVAKPELYAGGIVGLLQRTPLLRRLVQWCKTRHRLLPVYRARLTRRKIPMDLREYYCLKSMLRAVRRHRCSTYEGDVLYFRSHSVLGRDMGIPGWWDDPYLGFEALCGVGFEVHVVGGRHRDIMENPEIARIVRPIYEEKSNRNEENA